MAQRPQHQFILAGSILVVCFFSDLQDEGPLFGIAVLLGGIAIGEC